MRALLSKRGREKITSRALNCISISSRSDRDLTMLQFGTSFEKALFAFSRVRKWVCTPDAHACMCVFICMREPSVVVSRARCRKSKRAYNAPAGCAQLDGYFSLHWQIKNNIYTTMILGFQRADV